MFPAGAGVILHQIIITDDITDVPRRRGGDPLISFLHQLSRSMFPAGAGVIP